MPPIRFPFLNELKGSDPADDAAWGKLRAGFESMFAAQLADYAADHDAEGELIVGDTANNALHLNGKLESALGVASALNASKLGGKSEIDLNVNSAVFATATTIANTTVNGAVSIIAQSFAGDKTLVGNTTANNLTLTGNVLSNLVVAGLSTFVGNTSLSGFANVAGKLVVAGNSSFTGNIAFSDRLTGNGAFLTTTNASALGSGTVPTARLGSGTANSTTFLAGDQTYKIISGSSASTILPYAAGSQSIATGYFTVMSNHLIMTTTDRLTIAGTGRLRIT